MTPRIRTEKELRGGVPFLPSNGESKSVRPVTVPVWGAVDTDILRTGTSSVIDSLTYRKS